MIKAHDQELKAGDQELGVECRCSCPEPTFFIHVDVCFPSSTAPCLPLPQICKLEEPRGWGGEVVFRTCGEKQSQGTYWIRKNGAMVLRKLSILCDWAALRNLLGGVTRVSVALVKAWIVQPV